MLIAGGSGSLGRRLVRELVKPQYKIKTIRVLDNSEKGIADLQLHLKADDRIRYLIGDIRDKDRMERAMENIDVYIHCAALKRVEMCEYNPFESILTNVVGTQNCIDAALHTNVDRFIFISSDKAVSPCNIYGKCKSLSESLVLDAKNYKGDKKTIFSVVRPPNFINSDGSVFKIWEYQKKHGLPLKVTSDQMERYFMDFPDIVRFILKCVGMMKGGEIFIPSGAQKIKIIELARKLSDRIEIIGMRKGERMTELLMDPDYELPKAELVDGVWVIKNE